MATNSSSLAKVIDVYAKSVFEVSKSDLKKVKADLGAIDNLLYNSKEILVLIHNKHIKKKVLVNVFNEISTKYDLHIYVQNLIKLLIENNKISLLKKVIDRFHELYHVDNNELKVTMTFSKEVTQNTLNKLCNALESSLKVKIIPEVTINPEILDGFILQIGSQLIDGSLANQLNRIKSEIFAEIKTIK